MSASHASHKLAGPLATARGLALATLLAITLMTAPPTLATAPKSTAPGSTTSTPVTPISPATAADLVLTDGKIYTVDPARSIASALAIKDGKVVFVGSAADAHRWIGPKTQTEHLGGRLVLPGLIDSHIHPIDIVDLDICDLDSKPMPLAALTTFVAKCLARYKTPPGQRLVVHQWNYTAGNQPDAQHPTLRAALDAVSTKEIGRASCRERVSPYV